MHNSIFLALPLAISCLASPITFPLKQTGNFPNIQVPSEELNNTETAARGTLPGPNGNAPTGLQPGTLTVLQLIAFNEIHETAFFSQLLSNITDNVPGYTASDIAALTSTPRDAIVTSIQTVLAQEQLHALNAQGALRANDASKVVAPCTYNYPVQSFAEAIGLAISFTDVVMGTLGAGQVAVATNGDIGLVGRIASTIGQEGEQTGGFRALMGKTPSELPFLTASNPVFAFSVLNQAFVSQCPNSNYTPGQAASAGSVQGINIPILHALAASPANPEPRAQSITYTVNLSESEAQEYANFAMTYINQQNVPVTVPIADAKLSGTSLTFTASFPFDEATKGAFFGNGLTIGALTRTTGKPFASAADVAAASIAGPALFNLN